MSVNAVIAPNKRLLNLELLRIFSMLFIVCNHFLGHSLNLQDYDFEDPNRFILWFFRGVCYTGTNLFVIISAYFQCKSKFRVKGLLLLICKVLFYSIILYFLAVLSGLTDFSWLGIVRSCTPILSASYWFITCYIALSLLAPFINKLLSVLTGSQLKSLLIILFICFSVIPNFIFNSTWLNWGGSCGIVWFIFLYLVAGYIRLHYDILKVKPRRLIMVSFLFLLLPLITKIIIANLSFHFTGNVIGSSIFYSNNSILIFPLSILIFLVFLKIKITSDRYEKILTFISSSIFAVYLISEHPCISEFIWSNCSKLLEANRAIIPLYMIMIPIVILLICVLIDQVRKFIFWLVAQTSIPQKILSFVSKYTSKIYSGL